MRKRKICFVITSSIHYSRNKLILESISKNKNLELQIVVAASAILPRYGDIQREILEDGFKIDSKIIMTLEGSSNISMVKTTGIGVIEFATVFESLNTDIVVIRGDRYEIMSAAIAASYMNIPIAHIEGGDVSGNIDESVRHAVTKLSHIHFATNEESVRRIIQMGENPNNVFNFGSPEVELLSKHNKNINFKEINELGVGSKIDIEKQFLMVLFHPVTTESDNRGKTENLLHAINDLDIPTIWFWPNVDAGTDEVSKAIRVFRETKDVNNMQFLIYLKSEYFLNLLRKTACLVGNSSAGIKECSYLGIPVVNIGSRQNGRMQGSNVIDVNYSSEEIKKAINIQLGNGIYPMSNIYFNEDCSSKITNILANIKLRSQKKFYDYLPK
tara:strand:+ start:3610 stop:4767 length:1158 start_codon:yes stop_codon:yes gene_type:complete